MPRYKSRIFEAVHETAHGLHTIGGIDEQEMRRFDAICIDSVPAYTSEEIKELRTRLDLTQSVLASVLNTSISTVQKWEIGDKKPGGPSSKLLYLLDKNGLEALL